MLKRLALLLPILFSFSVTAKAAEHKSSLNLENYYQTVYDKAFKAASGHTSHDAALHAAYGVAQHFIYKYNDLYAPTELGNQWHLLNANPHKFYEKKAALHDFAYINAIKAANQAAQDAVPKETTKTSLFHLEFDEFNELSSAGLTSVL